MKKNRVQQLFKLFFIILALPTIAVAGNSIVEVEINVQSNDSLQQFDLTEGLYLRGDIKNLNQLSIVDKFGAALPFEVSKEQNEIQLQTRTVKIFALKEHQYLGRQTDNISLKYDSKNRLTAVNRNNSSSDTETVMGYLLDLGEKYPRVDSKLTFELSNAKDTSFLRFKIDRSSNLKNWRTVSNSEVLAQLVNNSVITKHNSITLRSARSRYLRLTIIGNNPQFKIYSAKQEFTQRAANQISWTSLKEMSFDEKEQAYLLDISPNLTYTNFQVEMPPAPSIITGTLLQKSNNKSRWTRSGQVNFININNENTKIMENKFNFWTRYKTQLKFSVNYSSPVLSKAPIWVKLSYRPQKITFFANGNWPYKLQLGTQLQLRNNGINPRLMATIRRQSGSAVGQALLGSSQKVEVDVVTEEINWKKILLWVVLVFGVAIMAWMAKNLLKQMD